jgi:hypothetical protein
MIDVEVAVDDQVDLARLDADAGQCLGDRRAQEAQLAKILWRDVRADAGVDEDRRLRMADEPGVDDHALARRNRLRRQEAADHEPGDDRRHHSIMIRRG